MTEVDDLSVSVLLPAFFSEANADDIWQLRRGIESVHAQEFANDYEILIVDDGSPTPIERFAALLGGHNLKKVRFLRCYRNYGLVHALNLGLREARYPLIARLDSDDTWLPTKLRKQLHQFTIDPSLTITATGMMVVSPDGHKQAHIRSGDWNDILRFFGDVGCPFPHGSVLARRNIYVLLGGYPHEPAHNHCEDYALWALWLRFFKPAMVEEVLYEYTLSGRSVSALNWQQQEAASQRVRMHFQKLMLVDRLPAALVELADAVGCSEVEAGILAYKMWRFRLAVRLPGSALAPLLIILPDRSVTRQSGGHKSVELKNLLSAELPSLSGKLLMDVRVF